MTLSFKTSFVSRTRVFLFIAHNFVYTYKKIDSAENALLMHQSKRAKNRFLTNSRSILQLVFLFNSSKGQRTSNIYMTFRPLTAVMNAIFYWVL